MAIQQINLGTAPGDDTGDGLRDGGLKINSNFTTTENAASKIVQASSADITADKVMMSDYAWRGAQLGDYFTYGGTADAITLTSANLKAGGVLIKGMRVRFEASAANTGATTIALDGGSAIACITPTGVALPSGFIRTDVFTEAEYDGTNWVVYRKVESGSNANGEWTRWEDGTQIIENDENLGSGSANGAGTLANPYRTNAVTKSFPVAFSATPKLSSQAVCVSAAATDRALTVGLASISSTSMVNLQAIRTSSTAGTDDVVVTYIAKGKWY